MTDVSFAISSGNDHFEMSVTVSDNLLSKIQDPDEFKNFIFNNCFRNNPRHIERSEPS